MLQTVGCVRLALRVLLKCWSPGILDLVKIYVFFRVSGGNKLVLIIQNAVTWSELLLESLCQCIAKNGVSSCFLVLFSVVRLRKFFQILKNGDKKNVANYRPISILPSFSKILEKLIYIRLMNHLETNNILAVEQFGFRTFSSTEQASFNFINNILTFLFSLGQYDPKQFNST